MMETSHGCAPVFQAPATDLEKLIVHPTAAHHERTLIFLHGYHMEAADLLDLFLALSRVHKAWRFVLPQAPKMRVTATGDECASWFGDLTDYQGASEDAIDVFSLRVQRESLRQILHAEVSLLEGRSSHVYLGGLSQGGTMALDAATYMQVGGVVTLLSPRSSASLSRPLSCPWLALMSQDDEVFPLSWARNLLVGACSVTIVPGTHWLEDDEERSFLRSSLEKFEAMVKNPDAGLQV